MSKSLTKGDNTYELRRMPDSGGQRHGGWRVYRHFNLYINGKKFKDYQDDCSSTGYSSDQYLDRYIDQEVNHMRKFFPGSYEKTESKSFKKNPNAGMRGYR